MEYEYTLYDIFDRSRKNPITRYFKNELRLGDEFIINDVTYRVVILARDAVVRMVKYKIPDTATQVVHTCPAKREMLEQLTKDDLLKLKAQKESVKSSRVKMPGLIVNQCPHCKVTFWKEKQVQSEKVEIVSLFQKSKRKRRRK